MSETIGMAVYALVDRICKCFETCAVAKARGIREMEDMINEHKN